MREIKISKNKLEYLYNSYTNKELRELLKVCNQTLYNMLDAAGIKRKKPNFKRGENIKYTIVD